MPETNKNIAVVVGAGGGIGAAVCRRLSASGHQVVSCDIDAKRARKAIEGLEGSHHFMGFDVSSEAEVARAFTDIEANIGPMRVVVVAAGLLLFEESGERPLIKRTTLDLWEKTFAVNTTGVFLCARQYINLRERRPVLDGRFITFGSVAAQLGGYRSSASYIASKSAVMGFTKALAREVADMGITVNSVAPGLIDTEMLRNTVRSSGDMDAAAANIPLGRIGTAQDVAVAVDFLASRESGYVTGSVIDVNGGYRMQ